MSDIPGAWYHCTRCGSLFKAAPVQGERGDCPSCGGNPASHGERQAPTRVRRKVRKPRAKSSGKRREGKRKARALMVFVIVWGFLLGAAAIWMKRRWQQNIPTLTVDDPRMVSGRVRDDERLLQDQLEACATRLREFLAASDIGGQSGHVLRPERTVQRMARFQQFDPIYASSTPFTAESYTVLHTPAGRVIETLWKQEDGQLVEAAFREEDGEWKIDWDAFVRLGSEPWPLFLAGLGAGEGDFRLLARERLGASGRDSEFIGLVFYATRPGEPGKAISPSPEIRVERNTPTGRLIEEAFAARRKGIGPFGSKVVNRDPDEMIRLRVRLTREGNDERVFRIAEVLATHWMELTPPPVKTE